MKPKYNTTTLLGGLALSLSLLFAVMAFSSCTVTVNPDGSKDVIVDAPSAMRVIEILAEK